MGGHRRILIVTTNLAGPGGDETSAAGNMYRAVIEEIGRRESGLVLAPRAADLPDLERIDGLHVLRVRPRRPAESLEDALRRGRVIRVGGMAWGLWRATRRAMAEERFDLAHAFWTFPAGWACTHPRAEIPVILTAPGTDLHGWSGKRIAGAPFRSVLQRADVVTPCGSDGVEQAEAGGARSVVQVPVAFDPRVFRLAGRVPDRPVVAFVGRMTRAKGVHVLGEALARLAPTVPGLSFVACGDGPDREAFEQAVRAALPGRSMFLGAVPPERVAETLAGARVAVLPSFGEGMSVAAIEAMATGRALVTTDTGEHVDVVRRGGGSVVPVGDADALASAIRAELASTRDPSAIRRLVEPYTPATVAGRFTDLYDELLSEPRARASVAA
ncbi:MAG: glycosyltransferase [Actinobacteria bacterium]|nr:glycosyltransferase [Actinomycetota bacterium]